MMIATTVCSSNENENEVCISVQQEQPPVLVGVLSILNGEDMSSAQMVPTCLDNGIFFFHQNPA